MMMVVHEDDNTDISIAMHRNRWSNDDDNNNNNNDYDEWWLIIIE